MAGIGILAIVIGYLLGSIPSAYIVTRLLTGKDIRQMGGGNVGARNVYREVGLGAAVVVGVFDVGKGAAAIVIAHQLLNAPLYETEPFVLAAGLAAVVGHIWSVYLKFSGGNGLTATIGVLALVMPWELLIVLAIMLILTAIIRNPILSLNISLLSLPISAWFLEKSWLPVTFVVLLILIMILHFIPTARVALAKAGSKQNLRTELLRQDRGEEEGS